MRTRQLTAKACRNTGNPGSVSLDKLDKVSFPDESPQQWLASPESPAGLIDLCSSHFLSSIKGTSWELNL
jgi:hypothetical protein